MRDKKTAEYKSFARVLAIIGMQYILSTICPEKRFQGKKKTHQRAFDLAINDLNKFLFELAVQFYRGLKLKRATSLLKVNAV
ncbi:MAG: hypothetical protein J6W67_08285 [Lentisphaeria bacterium]|nr:hypothetical protein [Lentisphaeria bacterium]